MLNKKLLLLILSIIFLLISFTGNFKVFIFCPAVIMFAIGAENYLVIKSNFIRKIFSTMGKLTYSCYLIHFPVSLSLILFFNQNTTIFLNHYFFLSYLTFIISISVFIYFLIEKKIQDYFRTKLLK
jgi:peptidoglycan/LPS O-acetylase OafA/YrhL